MDPSSLSRNLNSSTSSSSQYTFILEKETVQKEAMTELFKSLSRFIFQGSEVLKTRSNRKIFVLTSREWTSLSPVLLCILACPLIFPPPTPRCSHGSGCRQSYEGLSWAACSPLGKANHYVHRVGEQESPTIPSPLNSMYKQLDCWEHMPVYVTPTRITSELQGQAGKTNAKDTNLLILTHFVPLHDHDWLSSTSPGLKIIKKDSNLSWFCR